ncbi:MAG: hypothetical protein AAF988_03875 [Pseudomonadota bacterium]
MQAQARLDKDKFQFLSSILADTIRAYFYGADTPSLIHNIHACCTLIEDFKRFYKRQGILDGKFEFQSSRGLMHKDSEFAKTIREIGNNVKHADKNTNHVFQASAPLAHSYLLVTILNFMQLRDALLEGEAIALPDISSFSGLSLSASTFTTARTIWGISIDRTLRLGPIQIGPFKSARRQITPEEEKAYFDQWIPAVDRLSLLFVDWHMSTQPEEAKFTQKVSLPENTVTISNSVVGELAKAFSHAFSRAQEIGMKFSAPEEEQAYLASMVRYIARNIVVPELRSLMCDYNQESTLATYYTKAVSIADSEVTSTQTVIAGVSGVDVTPSMLSGRVLSWTNYQVKLSV